MATTDWYERRDELTEGQIFETYDGFRVRLDRRVPGDGSRWYVADWNEGYSTDSYTVKPGWSYQDGTIEPGDLVKLLEA